MTHRIVFSSVGATLAIVTASCGPHSAQIDPAAVAAVRADLRLVGSETTWVAHGERYELVARSKTDIAAVQTQLDRETAALRRVFPDDSLATLTVTVRRMVPDGQPYVTTAPLPNSTRGTVVGIVLPTAKALAEQEKTRGGLPGVRPAMLPAVRAWLSAHATHVTGTPARANEESGEFEDPRIPEWAQEMLPSLASDSLLDRFTTLLVARPDNLIPVATFFTAQRAPMAGRAIGERGAGADGNRGGRAGGAGGAGAGGGAGGRGGMGGGGRGGMGGGGRGGAGGMGGGGGGGGRGGAAGRGSRDDGSPGLQGSALFEAQSYMMGRYLTARDGPSLIGEILDGQLLRRPIDETLRRRKTVDFAHMDLDWLQWLLDRAAAVGK